MATYFDLVAPFYDRRGRRARKAVHMITSAVSFDSADVVVDLGGGGGSVARLLKNLTAHIVVIDPSRKMVAYCRTRGVLGIVGSAEDIPLSDESVDKVLLVDSFHHIHDQVRAVHEVRRILKPGGQVVLVEYNPNMWRGASLSFMEWLLGMGSTFHTPRALGTIFAAGGFKTRIEPSPHSQYLLVATK